MIHLQAEGVANADGHDQPSMGMLHPDPNAQLASGSGHTQQPPQGSCQPNDSFLAMQQQQPSQATVRQSVLQCKAVSRGIGMCSGKVLSPPASSQATDFSRFSLSALPSSRKRCSMHHQSSCPTFKLCVSFAQYLHNFDASSKKCCYTLLPSKHRLCLWELETIQDAAARCAPN